MNAVQIDNLPKVSIIIPCKYIDDYTMQCIQYCENIDYPEFEIIVLPDESSYKDNNKKVKIIPTGNVSPGKKRNIGVKNSDGEILAFIDSDAYPREDWLKNAVKYLENDKVAAVGGPGVTPKEDSDRQKVSGYIFSSFLVGNLNSRFKEKRAYESDDIHSCNFIAKRDVVEKVKWNEKYWPGEDTLMCLGIKKLGMKMVETPDVVVYHHRRPVFIPHLKQVSRFGLHRGFFAKKFPENSSKFTYYIPSLLIICFLVGGILSIFNLTFRTFYAFSLLMYLLLAFVAALHAKGFKLVLLTWIGIVLTHIVYGMNFLLGLVKKELER